jgi:hypothetical protein
MPQLHGRAGQERAERRGCRLGLGRGRLPVPYRGARDLAAPDVGAFGTRRTPNASQASSLRSTSWRRRTVRVSLRPWVRPFIAA